MQPNLLIAMQLAPVKYDIRCLYGEMPRFFMLILLNFSPDEQLKIHIIKRTLDLLDFPHRNMRIYFCRSAARVPQ
jgi:hypothetical protein